MMSKDRHIVLVVDDDQDMLKCVQRLLAARLFLVRRWFSKTTPMSKRQLASSSTSTLTDGSGIDLRHGLNDAGISVPVIKMTGNDDPAMRRAAPLIPP
jgi:FixJ family two-component response regulator